MASKTLRAAAIGLRDGHMGSIGPEKPAWIHTFRQVPGVEVVAYCEDTAPEKLNAAKVYHPEANLYTSVDELIDKEDFDFAFMAMPACDIPVVGTKLARAGKHFFMEKQFARNSDDLAEMVREVHKAGVKVMPGYPHRFNPVCQELRSIIDSGALGKMLDLEATMITGQVRPGGRDPRNYKYTLKEEGGGIMHMLGCHYLDVIRFLAGCEVKRVQAMNGRPVGYIDKPLEDISIALFEFENGGYGSMHAGYLQRTGDSNDNSLVWRGMEGEADLNLRSNPSLTVKSASPEWAGAPVKKINYTFAEGPSGYAKTAWMFNWIKGFVDAVRNDTKPPLTEMDALHVLQLIDAIYESALSGRAVDVKYGV